VSPCTVAKLRLIGEMKDRTGFLRSLRFTAYVLRSPRSRTPDGSFAKRPFRFLKLQGSPAALTLTLLHPFSRLLLASHRRLPASPAASTVAPPWSPPPPAHHPLSRIYLPRRWLFGAPSPRGSPSSPSPRQLFLCSVHLGLRSGGRIRRSGECLRLDP
jgi:hypothetical protein